MIYVASYFTQGSFDAEIDDPSVRDSDLETEASPQVSRAALAMTDAWVERCKQDVEEELLECEFDDQGRASLAEELAQQAWRDAGRFTGSYWDYEHGAIYPTPEGRFEVRGEAAEHDTLAAAEWDLFAKRVAPHLPAPPPPEFEWETAGWQEPERGRPHQVFHCSVGGEVVACLVVQQIEED